MDYGNADALEHTETPAANFAADSVVRFWQHNTMRMIRANERVLRGLMWAAKREIELGQELMRYNLENLQGTAKRAANGGEPDVLNKNHIERNAGELEHFAGGMREVAEELRQCFSEAAKLLFEGSVEEAREVTAKVGKAAAEAGEAVAEPIKKTVQKAQATIKPAVESTTDD